MNHPIVQLVIHIALTYLSAYAVVGRFESVALTACFLLWVPYTAIQTVKEIRNFLEE